MRGCFLELYREAWLEGAEKDRCKKARERGLFWIPLSCFSFFFFVFVLLFRVYVQTPGVGDFHGCPFKHFDKPQLQKLLSEFGLNCKSHSPSSSSFEKCVAFFPFSKSLQLACVLQDPLHRMEVKSSRNRKREVGALREPRQSYLGKMLPLHSIRLLFFLSFAIFGSSSCSLFRSCKAFRFSAELGSAPAIKMEVHLETCLSMFESLSVHVSTSVCVCTCI